MDERLVMGIDIGTSSTKGILCDGEGHVLAAHQVEHDVVFPHPGWAEHDADQVWWGEVCQVSQALLAQVKAARRRVSAVGVSAIAPALVPVDGEGRALRRGILYGVDARASDQIARINTRLGAETIATRTGNQLSSQSLLPKMLWLKENEPEVWARTAQLLTATGYVALKLTGRYCVDYFTATVAGLVDLATLEDALDLMREFGLDPALWPKPVWSNAVVGRLTGQAALATGLPEGVPVIAGTCDAAAEAVGAHVTEPGDLVLIYGSTFSMVQCLDRPRLSPGLFAGSYCLPGTYTTGGATGAAGNLTKWVRDQLGEPEREAERLTGLSAYRLLMEEAERVPPGANGLLALPYFAGARTPVNDPLARGIVVGLTLQTTRADLYRALLESVGFEIRHHLEEMSSVDAAPKRVFAIGGGTQNPLWMQAVSDITGLEQNCLGRSMGAPYGDAMLAWTAVEPGADLGALAARWIKVTRVVRPAPELRARYDELYVLYRELYQRTRDVVHRLPR